MIFNINDLYVYSNTDKRLIDVNATLKKADDYYHELMWQDFHVLARQVKFFINNLKSIRKEGQDYEPCF